MGKVNYRSGFLLFHDHETAKTHEKTKVKRFISSTNLFSKNLKLIPPYDSCSQRMSTEEGAGNCNYFISLEGLLMCHLELQIKSARQLYHFV